MDGFVPIAIAALLVIGLAVAEARLARRTTLPRMPWYVGAGGIFAGVLLNRLVRDAWPLEGWWSLPRSVVIVGLACALMAWVWARRTA